MGLKIVEIYGKLEVLTGMHIGAGNSEIHIGGIDDPVVRNSFDENPYIPGSSLKGKIRSLLELSEGIIIDENPSQRNNSSSLIPIIFGDTTKTESSRVIFRDCFLSKESEAILHDKDILPTEEKNENQIDRISGTAKSPRNIERVISGMIFDFEANVKILKEGEYNSFKKILEKGFDLLEHDSLGGSGSRGYGKVKFSDLKWVVKEY